MGKSFFEKELDKFEKWAIDTAEAAIIPVVELSVIGITLFIMIEHLI